MKPSDPGPDRPVSAWSGLAHDPRHGPLPALFLVLTALTGVIDAVCLLSLGRVFVANMTGNLLFVGLTLAGAPGFERLTSVAALVAFAIGAFAGGRMISRIGAHRGRLLRNAMAAEFVLTVAAMIVVIAAGGVAGPVAPLVAALLALGMGNQNAVVRRIAVPDLPTTVLTMTVTGILADERGGGRWSLVRRSMAVLVMLVGAVVGALLVLHAGLAWALAASAALVAVVLLIAVRSSREPADWHTAGGG